MNMRELLRSETRNEHTAIEAVMPFGRPDFDVAGYRRLLESFYAFYLPLERTIMNSVALRESEFDYAQRMKTPLLEKDLRALGADPSTVSPAPASALPDISDFDRLLGCLYVIEGSTLGGQLLQKNLSRNLQLSSDKVSFYGSYGANVGERWAEFLEFLKSQERDAEGNALALESARETFRTLRLWLGQA